MSLIFFCSNHLYFIPANKEPSEHACMCIWRMQRGSNPPLLCCAAGLISCLPAAGVLTHNIQILLRHFFMCDNVRYCQRYAGTEPCQGICPARAGKSKCTGQHNSCKCPHHKFHYARYSRHQSFSQALDCKSENEQE